MKNKQDLLRAIDTLLTVLNDLDTNELEYEWVSQRYDELSEKFEKLLDCIQSL